MQRSHRRQRRGATAVEFALLSIFLVSIMAGMIDYGWILFHQSALDSSITVGCRSGALLDPGDGDAFLQDVLDKTDEALNTALASYGAGGCGDACTTEVVIVGMRPGRSLLCSVQRDVQPIVGMVAGPITLSSRIAVRLEWQRGD